MEIQRGQLREYRSRFLHPLAARLHQLRGTRPERSLHSLRIPRQEIWERCRFRLAHRIRQIHPCSLPGNSTSTSLLPQRTRSASFPVRRLKRTNALVRRDAFLRLVTRETEGEGFSHRADGTGTLPLSYCWMRMISAQYRRTINGQECRIGYKRDNRKRQWQR
jgi:hypothetical protein